jgi:hypothetical protein
VIYLRHDRNCDCGSDFIDHGWIRHSSYPSVISDISRYSLEGHDGDSTGCLGDLGLFNVDYIHNHAAFQHLGQAGLHDECRITVVSGAHVD